MSTDIFSRSLSSVGLGLLRPYVSVLLGSATVCFLVQPTCQYLASKLAPDSYQRLSPRQQRDYGLHGTAFVHALWAAPTAIYLLTSQDPSLVALRRNPVLGYSDSVALAMAIGGGYFLWDVVTSIAYNLGPGFITHGCACMFGAAMSFRPIAQGFGPVLLLWELSTIPLNIHWFLDKLGKTGSTLQLINGVILIITFFAVRVVGGLYSSYWFAGHLLQPEIKAKLGRNMVIFYLLGLGTMECLNLYWFRAMITALTKRFQSGDKAINPKDKKNN